MNNIIANKKNLTWIGEDEEICSKCNGSGFTNITKARTLGITTANRIISSPCSDCSGYGKLDWCRRLVLGIR